ncbi:YceD family protein [Sporosarcina aquimarina]|uniref:YceD family protein n=1 Tax=Sporosarcina aquimarina TaxID=114975 RepID=A0ABU4G0Z0_9BACL|nr:YceD family protein [Sporosarcina aquimarina]MDW0109327.1 YceD family protein [Sporosarcina aquimarina]
MKWSIHQLRKFRQGAMPLDEVVDLGSVRERNSEIRAISPVRLTGSCTVGSKKVSFHFHLEGSMTLPCARTWEDVHFPFSIETDEQFSWDEEVLAQDDEIHPIVGDTIDPMPVFEELILLEVPLQVYCDDADTVTEASGTGWSYTTDEVYNEKLTEEQDKKTDPRLAGLARFFESDND